MTGASSAARYLDAVMVWAGLTFVTGRSADAAYDRLLTEARQRGDTVNEVEGLIGVARVAARARDWARVREHALAALELAESTGDGAHRRVPAHALAAAARAMGDYAEARRRYTESCGTPSPRRDWPN
jgi:hypothetical protein